jgi:uracil-DNA glycosylase
MRTVTLLQPDDFDAWRDAARGAILCDVPPDQIIWQSGLAPTDLFAEAAPALTTVGALSMTQAFMALARRAIYHSDPERFALLYTLLWRIQKNRDLMNDHADPLRRRIETLAQAVGRDSHKMHAFVRFREIEGRFVAWFEPDHHIVRSNAGFFVRRFASMAWSILTPELSIHWDGTTLSEGPGAQKSDAPNCDPLEEVWKTYYASTFNPARVKVGAMMKEMPKKYWKNMPETDLIPSLIANAQAREAGMIVAPAKSGSILNAWNSLRLEAAACTRCPLWKPATQIVFGEGPDHARLMFIGEQPGDNEDVAGRPFVGPAGQLLGQALAQAGIDRAQVYITNAVKHFKFEQRGKRRIHSTPTAGEIDICRWWIDQERSLVRPSITVALGASAARSLFGKTMAINQSRGQRLALSDGGEAYVTVHPSYLLRIADSEDMDKEYARFVEELAIVRERLAAKEMINSPPD